MSFDRVDLEGWGQKMAKRIRSGIVVIVVLFVMAFVISACGNASTDGGWLAHGSQNQEVYFLQISGNTGTVDYADYIAGQGVNRFHGLLMLHDDNTIEVDGMQDGELYGCSACPYQLTNGNLVIDYTYESYGGGGQVSGVMTFSSSDSSSYEQAVNSIHS